MIDVIAGMLAWVTMAVLAPEAGAIAAPPATTTAAKVCGGDDPAGTVTQLLPGYGSGGFRISTPVPQAQAFFDNGMQLAAAFAHKAAVNAMHEAVRRDPNCAMCAWGEAWALGPTINYAIGAGEVARPAGLVLLAERLAAARATERERALIAALKLRYASAQKGRTTNDAAYAAAMTRLAARYPNDDAIGTLAADAVMVAAEGKTRTRDMRLAVGMLEGVLARSPDYTPAIHFYIHATEEAGMPGAAERYADTLAALAPRSSHLIHMPSHTFYWVGRYQDAADTNARAVEIGIDNARLSKAKLNDGVFGLPYHAHNVHFGIGGAMMSGDGAKALALSGPLVRTAAQSTTAPVFQQLIAGMGYAAEGRHGEPAAVLALPEPKLPYTRAFWHYARGEAHARRGDAAAVRGEALAVLAAVDGPARLADKAGAPLIRIAGLVLTGRAAMLDGDHRAARKAFAKAAKIEEGRIIGPRADPPLWWYPPRRSLAEAKLAAGDAKGALAEANRVLARRLNDPMTLAVRARAEGALGDKTAARRDARAALRGWNGERSAFSRI